MRIPPFYTRISSTNPVGGIKWNYSAIFSITGSLWSIPETIIGDVSERQSVGLPAQEKSREVKIQFSF